jgi:hypothetical protein
MAFPPIGCLAALCVDRIASREVELLADYPDDVVLKRVQFRLDA